MEENSKGRFTSIILIILILSIIAGLGVLAIKYMYIFEENDIEVQAQQELLEDDIIETKENDNESIEIIAAEEKNENKNEENKEVSDNNYHYKQIDDTAKKIYNKMNGSIEKMKTGTYTINFGQEFNDLLHKSNGKNTLNKAYQQAIDALMLDYPEYFFIDVEKLIMTITSTTTGSKTTYEVAIGNDEESYLEVGFSNKNDVDAAITEVRNARGKISGNSTYEVILSAHDLLVDNVEYDKTLSNQNIRNVYGTLCNNKAVCEGYAKTFKYMMDAVNIPCIVVIGNATNSKGENESHAWNYVKIDGIWYGIDATWDDPVLIGGGKLSNKDKYKYFLRGKSLLDNHTPTGLASQTGIAFSYPELGDVNRDGSV